MTISREIKRNRPTYADDAVYWYDAAQFFIDQRKRMPHHAIRQSNPQLVHYVKCKLAEDWSPPQIASRLTIDYPNSKTMRVCHETIYQWIYSDAMNGGDLYTHLRRYHKRRRKQRRYGSGRGLIPGRVSISERPEAVDNRKRFGDWEGDTVEGAKGNGGIASHVGLRCHIPPPNFSPSGSPAMLCPDTRFNICFRSVNRDNSLFNVRPNFSLYHPQIIFSLQIQPKLSFNTKIALQSQCGIGSDRPFPVDDFTDSIRRNRKVS